MRSKMTDSDHIHILFTMFFVPMMWKQRKWMNGVEGAYSHLVYAVLDDAKCRNSDIILHVEDTFTELRYHCNLKP